MNQEFEDELSPEERQALDSLAREKMPPSFLEERIVEALKRSDRIRSSKTRWWSVLPKIGLAATASLLLFTLGLMAGIWWISAETKKSEMPEFMLVLRSSPEQSQDISRDEVLTMVKEYSAWAREIEQRGLLLGGEKLKQEARLLRTIDGRMAVSENLPDSKENAIEGYFLIQAKDYKQAITIAQGCPHLKYGGSIEIRQIDQF
jgi:hypothetical protein